MLDEMTRSLGCGMVNSRNEVPGEQTQKRVMVQRSEAWGRDRMRPTTRWGSCGIVCCGGAADPEGRG